MALVRGGEPQSDIEVPLQMPLNRSLLCSSFRKHNPAELRQPNLECVAGHATHAPTKPRRVD